VESRIASVEINLNRLGRSDHISFDSFAPRTVLGNSSTEDHQTVFRHRLEESDALRDFDNGILNIFSGGGRFYVGSCSVLLFEHRDYFADLTPRRNIKGNEFCPSTLFGCQRLQCSSKTKSLEGRSFGTQIAFPRLDRRATPQWNR